MITVGMNYRVKEGKGPEFEDAFRKVLAVMAGMPGHTESHLYQDTDDSTSYVILSEWNDRGAFAAFMRSPQFAAVADWGGKEILAERPRHQVYERGGMS